MTKCADFSTTISLLFIKQDQLTQINKFIFKAT